MGLNSSKWYEKRVILMGYKIQVKKSENIREQWSQKRPDFSVEMSADEIRSLGGSQRYGQGGRWVSDEEYIAINGHKSRGGMPLKLMTSSGEIPISTTDAGALREYLKPFSG